LTLGTNYPVKVIKVLGLMTRVTTTVPAIVPKALGGFDSLSEHELSADTLDDE
jgi:hypothetical protein